MHRFFHERGYYWISTPIVTTSDAEGAGQMFRVSTLDLTDGAVRGGELRDCTVGASWYADPNLRVMVNYVYIDRRSIGRAHALVVRLQLEI